MRGKYIQYNLMKKDVFSPEDATSQNIQYIDYSEIITSIFKKLLNISIPDSSLKNIQYSRNYEGKPEVIAVSDINGKKVEMKFNFPDKKKSLLNPSITEIIDKLQIGDILTYYNGKSGNSIMIYDIIKDKINNNTKVLVIYSDGGIGKAYVNSKIPHLLYLNKKKNPNFDNWEQGSIGIQNINKYSQWMDINKTGLNYSIIRYIKYIYRKNS